MGSEEGGRGRTVRTSRRRLGLGTRYTEEVARRMPVVGAAASEGIDEKRPAHSVYHNRGQGLISNWGGEVGEDGPAWGRPRMENHAFADHRLREAETEVAEDGRGTRESCRLQENQGAWNVKGLLVGGRAGSEFARQPEILMLRRGREGGEGTVVGCFEG